MSIVDLVISRLSLPSSAALARLVGVSRTAPAEWRRRLGGNIPTRHWPRLVDEAKKLSVKLTYEELRGE